MFPDLPPLPLDENDGFLLVDAIERDRRRYRSLAEAARQRRDRVGWAFHMLQARMLTHLRNKLKDRLHEAGAPSEEYWITLTARLRRPEAHEAAARYRQDRAKREAKAQAGGEAAERGAASESPSQ